MSEWVLIQRPENPRKTVLMVEHIMPPVEENAIVYVLTPDLAGNIYKSKGVDRVARQNIKYLTRQTTIIPLSRCCDTGIIRSALQKPNAHTTKAKTSVTTQTVYRQATIVSYKCWHSNWRRGRLQRQQWAWYSARLLLTNSEERPCTRAPRAIAHQKMHLRG